MSDALKFINYIRSYLLPLLFICTVLILVYIFWPVFLPFLLSFILAYLLNPIVNSMEYRGLNRTQSISVLYFIIFIILVVTVMFLVPILSSEIETLKTQLPSYLTFFQKRISSLEYKLTTSVPFLDQLDLGANIVNRSKAFVQDFIIDIPNFISGVVSLFYLGILIPFITFFLLRDGYSFRKGFIKLIPNKYFEMLLGLIFRLEQQIGGFLQAKLLQMIIVTLVSSIGLFVIDIPYSFFIGLFAGIMNIIPYVGPVAGAIPALIIAFVIHQNAVTLIPVIIVFSLVQLLDNIILQPVLVGKSVDMHPLLVIISLTIGGYVAGIWGMLLGIPIIGMLKIIIQELYKEINYRINLTRSTPIET